MKIQNQQRNLYAIFIFLAILLSFSLINFDANADPAGANLVSNVTESTPYYTPSNRTDDGGTITITNMDVVQQNFNWKAYVGNLSGTLTLDDSNGNTIYQWALGASEITGEVYSSRAETPTWSTLNCSNTTAVQIEDSALGFLGSQVDTINKTFNETTHQAITVAGRTIAADTCRATATFESDAKPDQSTANFQEILFQSDADLIYATPINYNTTSFNAGNNVDFQLILADDVTAASTTYYFFVEIGG